MPSNPVKGKLQVMCLFRYRGSTDIIDIITYYTISEIDSDLLRIFHYIN